METQRTSPQAAWSRAQLCPRHGAPQPGWWLSTCFCYELKTSRAGALTKAKLCAVGVRETTNVIDVKNTTGPDAMPLNRSVISDLLQQPDLAGTNER